MLKVKLQINKPLPFYLLKPDNIAISDVTGIHQYTSSIQSNKSNQFFQSTWINQLNNLKN